MRKDCGDAAETVRKDYGSSADIVRTKCGTGGCLFTQSHADHVIGLQDERSLILMRQMCWRLRLRTAGPACSPQQVRQFIDLVMFYLRVNERG